MIVRRVRFNPNARGFGGGRDGDRDAHPRRGVFVVHVYL